MQILAITLRNIKSHRDRELHFVKGINVLSGVNGVGKSTIFEAIGYALFGVDARDFVGNVDRFLTIGAKKGEVSVTFATDGGETYRVSRSVGAGAKWLLARETGGAFEVEDHAGAAETEARLKELLGLDSGRALAEQFKLVIGPLQHEFLGPFVLKQPTRRQEAFDEILGIDAWRKTYKGTSTLLKTVQSKIDVLTVEIEGRQEQLQVLPERQQELTGLLVATQSRQQELAAKVTSLTEIDQEFGKLDAQEKKAIAVRAEIQILANRLRDGEGKIADQNQRVAEAESALATLARTKAGREAFEAAEADLKALRAKDVQRRAIEKEITGLEKESVGLAQSLAHENREVAQTARELAEEEGQLLKDRAALAVDDALVTKAARLPDLRQEAEKIRSAQGLLQGRRAGLQEGQEKLAAGLCPYFAEPCMNIAGQSPRDVFTARLDQLDLETLALGKRLAQVAQEISTAERALQEIESRKVRAQENAKQLSALHRRREQNNSRRLALGVLGKQQAEAENKALARKEDLKTFGDLDGAITRAEQIRTEHQAARDTYFAHQKDARDLENRRESRNKMVELFAELKQTLAAQQNQLAALEKEYDQKRHAEVRLAKEHLVAAMATLRQQIADLDKDRARLAEEIKRLDLLKAEIATRSAAKKILAEKAELVTFLRNKIFNNVSAQLSARFREEISLRADRIYRIIAETDEELSWGDKYQIVLRDMVAGQMRERTDDQLSGGQIMSSVVALRLAMLQTIGARIAFFDEPTSNLDASRRENLARAFRAIDIGREEVTEHWYDQLFLISHDVAFTEITDQIIELE